MKKTLKKWAVSAGLIAALSGCIADEPLYTEGEGTLYLSTRINSDVQVKSRAAVEGLAETCDIWIANDKGIVRQYNGTADVPADGIKLVTGNYKVMVWAGDSLPASWTDRFFKGTESFTLNAGDNKAVTVVGKIANSVVAVNFDATVADVLTDYSLAVGHSQGKLTFDSTTEPDARGYFMMNSRDKDLTWTLSGTRLDGSDFSRTGTIAAAQPATLYTLNIKCTEDNTEYGGAYLDVTVDETTIDKEFDITIDAAPEIRGIDFDLNQIQRASENNMGKRSVWITATTDIKSLVLTCDYFDTLFGFGGENDFDFFQMTDESLRNEIAAKGISYIYSENPQDNFGPDGQPLVLPTVKLNFESEFTNKLPEGNYPIKIEVTDAKGKYTAATLRLVISDAPLSVAPVDEVDIWSTHAIVSISIEKDGIENPVIKYRKKGTLSWEASVEAKALGRSTVLSAELSGLTPGTTYEFCGATDDFESSVGEFTTEEALQLPNAGFEEWYQDGKLYFPQSSASATQFWGCGNTALKSYTAFVTECPTSPATSPKNSGNYSAQLKSINVAGLAFAAGNIFIGEFIRTDGTSGVLGWGRPWASRPSKLKGWVKYTPAKISASDNSYPDLPSGATDKGTIYIAMLDDSQNSSDSGKEYPVIVKNKKTARELFDKDGSNVIAYGELVFDKATDGDDLIEFEIPIVYRRTDIKPKYIMCTASSSIAGDYFVGGAGSVMYIDDFELVYE